MIFVVFVFKTNDFPVTNPVAKFANRPQRGTLLFTSRPHLNHIQLLSGVFTCHGDWWFKRKHWLDLIWKLSLFTLGCEWKCFASRSTFSSTCRVSIACCSVNFEFASNRFLVPSYKYTNDYLVTYHVIWGLTKTTFYCFRNCIMKSREG